MLVLIATAFAVVGGSVGAADSTARRHPRSLRHPGHRLHRVSGTGAAGGRGSGHLSADHGDADRAEDRRWCVGSRSSACRFVYVIFEDGTDIYWARSRVLEYLNAAGKRLARWRDAGAGSGRHRRRLGLPIRASLRRTNPWPSCARCRIGRSASRWPRPKASPRSPASAASSSSTTSSSIPAACARWAFRCPRCARSSARTTWTSAAARWSLQSTSSWCAAVATSKASTTSNASSSR